MKPLQIASCTVAVSSSNQMTDIGLNGTLRHAQPDKLLEAAARTKVCRYQETYATRQGVSYAFLPRVMRTSGRIHG